MACRKHALTLQLHTAHILSAHASLDSKSKAIQDVKEQKNKCVRSTPDSDPSRSLNARCADLDSRVREPDC